MCLAIVGIRPVPDLALLLIGNRDEFHARQSAAAGWWDSQPELLAGRDLEAGGTWLGIRRDGRYGLITNVREAAQPGEFDSRGSLLHGALSAAAAPADYVSTLASTVHQYRGFNLVLGDAAGHAVYCSNRAPMLSRTLPAGLNGVSNALLDTPWPRLMRVRAGVEHWLESGSRDTDRLMDVFLDRAPTRPDNERAPQLTPEQRLALSAPFVIGERYGTRATTLVLIGRDGRCHFQERRFDAAGRDIGETVEQFSLTSSR